MGIWFKKYSLEDLNALGKQTMLAHLDIRITEMGENSLTATMPVDHRTVQPMRLLHGGASVTLAESLGSIAGSLVLDPAKQYCVGIEINANHLRSVTQGLVTGTTRPIRIGKKIQVWETKIFDQQQHLVCISRITLAVLDKR